MARNFETFFVMLMGIWYLYVGYLMFDLVWDCLVLHHYMALNDTEAQSRERFAMYFLSGIWLTGLCGTGYISWQAFRARSFCKN